MKTQKEVQIQDLSKQLQKEVDFILSDLEKYIVDSDDDSLKIHIDVDLVLENSSARSHSKEVKHKPKLENSVKKDNETKSYSAGSEVRVYDCDFHTVSKRKLRHNPFSSKINNVVKFMFS